MTFETGVAEYLWFTCSVRVPFPVDAKGRADVRCDNCPYIGRTSKKCLLNGKVLFYPDRYIGDQCPLQPVQEENTCQEQSR